MDEDKSPGNDIMKKVSKIVIGLILVGMIALAWHREFPLELPYNWFAQGIFVSEDTDTFDPGPVTGSHFPGLQAEYNGGRVTLLTDFAGAAGTVLVVLRSLAKSTICQQQLVQLEALYPQFSAAGIGLVVISPDEPFVQDTFATEYGITIPLLSDTAALSTITLGIQNQAYSRSDRLYGTPYAGSLVISRDQRIVGKLFLENDNTRVDAAATLSFARHLLQH